MDQKFYSYPRTTFISALNLSREGVAHGSHQSMSTYIGDAFILCFLELISVFPIISYNFTMFSKKYLMVQEQIQTERSSIDSTPPSTAQQPDGSPSFPTPAIVMEFPTPVIEMEQLTFVSGDTCQNEFVSQNASQPTLCSTPQVESRDQQPLLPDHLFIGQQSNVTGLHPDFTPASIFKGSDGWRWELLSWTFSLVCFCGLVIMLYHFDNKPPPQWKYGMGISFNTAISVFATITKVALMGPVTEYISQLKWLHYVRRPQRLRDLEDFDNASRGEIGSLVFLTGSLHQ